MNRRSLRRIAFVLLISGTIATTVIWLTKRPKVEWYARDPDSSQALKVLFIGNSLTYYHDMPGIVVELFRQADPERPLKVGMVTGPGFKLSQHLACGDAMDAIENEGPWDWIILQEYGGLTYREPEEAAASLKTFADATRKSGARPIVYVDWHSAAVPDRQSLLETLASELDLPCAPVAQVWHLSQTRHPEIELLMQDEIHPTEAGSYLIALVFYTYLSHDNPTGLIANGLPGSVAGDLQTITWETVGEQLPASPVETRPE